jgi:predicted DNA-binding transcriptional regulator AlpA
MAESLLTRADVAKQLGVSPKTLAQWAWRQQGPRLLKFGKTVVRYRQSDVDAWLASRQQGGEVAMPELTPVLRVLGRGSRGW